MDALFTATELAGTIAFAVSGAMLAVKKRLDIFGILFLGLITALGGGTIRDLLLG
ncbi:MAG: TRIC cation channel family protein, partial [Oscillospiraceae bacterium]|nr:TRIC cation channel family protein [Oscillospiraceae bacterium]